jgi:hypothetical protein
MGTIYVFVCILGFVSYSGVQYANTFKGSSKRMKDLFAILPFLGYLSYFASIVMLFFVTYWWIPILLFIISSLSGALQPIVFRRNPAMMIICLICIVIFSWLSVNNIIDKL